MTAGTVTVTATDSQGNRATATASYTISSQPFLPYGATSFLQEPATGAPIDTATTAAMRNFMATYSSQVGFSYPVIHGTGSSLWGMPFAQASPGDPTLITWHLTGVNSNPQTAFLGTNGPGFKAPSWLGSVLTGTSDSPFLVQDLTAGFTVAGSQASLVSPGVINCGVTPQVFLHSSNGLDSRNPLANTTANWSSRGRILEGFCIRHDMVQWAIASNCGLGYVLEMWCAATTSAFCHPMVGDEGHTGGFCPEGQRMIIDPSIDLTTRGLSPTGLAIARTLQDHGLYIGDTSGSESALKAEQENSGHPVWNGTLPSNVLQGITWNDFLVIQAGWQKSG